MTDPEPKLIDRREFHAELDADTVTIFRCNPRNSNPNRDNCETFSVPRDQFDRIVRAYLSGEGDV